MSDMTMSHKLWEGINNNIVESFHEEVVVVEKNTINIFWTQEHQWSLAGPCLRSCLWCMSDQGSLM